MSGGGGERGLKALLITFITDIFTEYCTTVFHNIKKMKVDQ